MSDTDIPGTAIFDESLSQIHRGRRRRKKFTPTERTRIAQIRKAGACAECRARKVRCLHVFYPNLDSPSAPKPTPQPYPFNLDEELSNPTYPSEICGHETCQDEAQVQDPSIYEGVDLIAKVPAFTGREKRLAADLQDFENMFKDESSSRPHKAALNTPKSGRNIVFETPSQPSTAYPYSNTSASERGTLPNLWAEMEGLSFENHGDRFSDDYMPPNFRVETPDTHYPTVNTLPLSFQVPTGATNIPVIALNYEGDNNLEECMTLFSRDSGYASAASKRTNVVQNHTHNIQDPSAWDSQSIASLRSSHTEITASSINPAALGGAAEELAETLMQDGMIHTLILEGYACIEAGRFERNFQRILKHYASNLRNEAKSDLEKGAVRIVHSYRAYVTRIIRRKLSLVEDEHASALDELVKQESSKLALERFLEQLQATSKDDAAIKAEDDELDSDNGSEFSNDDKPYLPNLEKVKDFLTLSAAFVELRQHLLDFVRPSDTTLPAQPPSKRVAASQVIETNQFVENNAAERLKVDSEINKSIEEVEMPEYLSKRNGIGDSELSVKQPESMVFDVQKVLGVIDDHSAISFHVEAQERNDSTAQVSKNSNELNWLKKGKPHTMELEEMEHESEKSPAAGNIGQTTKITDLHAQTGELDVRPRKGECIKPQSLRRERAYEYLQKLGRPLLLGLQNRWKRSWRPKPAEGYKRIEWTCECGHDLYADFKNTSQSKLEKMAAILQRAPTSGGATSSGNISQPPSCITPQPVVQISSRSSSNESNQSLSDDVKGTSVASVNDLHTPSFLELCVNTGMHLKSLGEINLTNVHSDGDLFKAVKEHYVRLRSFRAKFWLLKPTAVSYVRFSLENRHRVGILQKPLAVPPKSEVAAKRWIYEPCPLDGDPPIAENLFLHYLQCSERSGTLFWMLRLPRKLHTSILTTAAAATAFGWGIHIDEGPNYVAIFWANFIVLVLSGVAALLWNFLEHDFQGAFGFGCWIIAVLNSLVMVYVFKWRQE